jgi:collagen type VI alpha
VSREELKSIRDRDDADYPDYMVIITDGYPNEPGMDPAGMAWAEANASKAEGITIYVVGVGSGVNQAYCEGIASSPDHYFAAADWDDLADILANLINCPNP